MPLVATVTVVEALEEHRIFSSLAVPRSMTTPKFVPGEPGQPVAEPMTKEASPLAMALARTVVVPPPAK
jgi:hypothetical protein